MKPPPPSGRYSFICSSVETESLLYSFSLNEIAARISGSGGKGGGRGGNEADGQVLPGQVIRRGYRTLIRTRKRGLKGDLLRILSPSLLCACAPAGH